MFPVNKNLVTGHMDSLTLCVVRKKVFFVNGDSATNITRNFRLYFDIPSRGEIFVRNTVRLLRTLNSVNNFVVVKLEV